MCKVVNLAAISMSAALEELWFLGDRLGIFFLLLGGTAVVFLSGVNCVDCVSLMGSLDTLVNCG